MNLRYRRSLGGVTASLLMLGLSACFHDTDRLPAESGTAAAESGGVTATSSDGTGEGSGDSSGGDNDPSPCTPGEAGCACAPGDVCDELLVCNAGFCMPEGCTPGTLNCSCDGGQCEGELACEAGPGGDICVEAMEGGTDTDQPPPDDKCAVEGGSDGGTCTIWGYADDADDVAGHLLNGDIRFAFTESRSKAGGQELILGMGFHDPLSFTVSSAVFELWWYFDVDNNSATGSEQVHMFGGDTYIRVELDVNRAGTVKVGDGNDIGNGTLDPGASVEVLDGGRMVLVTLDMPDELESLVDGTWVGVSGGYGGNFQADTDKTPIRVYRPPDQPLAEDCDNDGYLDACVDSVDGIGWGQRTGDGVPDVCQQDKDNNGIDDSCQ